MQHGAISSRILLSIFCGLSFTVSASDEALQYLKAMNLDVRAINQNQRLTNINLKSAVTDQGLVYFDEKKDIFFTKTKPLVKVGDTLDLADRNFYHEYLSTVPNVVTLKSPKEKLEVYIFTDITCSWCQKIHLNTKAYLDAGITLKFLYFPRNGLDTVEAKQMSAISQAKTPSLDLEAAFKGQYIDTLPVNDVVRTHFIAGKGLDVQETPTLVVNGYPFAGYLTPEQIIAGFTD